MKFFVFVAPKPCLKTFLLQKYKNRSIRPIINVYNLLVLSGEAFLLGLGEIFIEFYVFSGISHVEKRRTFSGPSKPNKNASPGKTS